MIPSLTPAEFSRACCELAYDKRAENAVIIDLRRLNAPADYFVICNGSTEKQVRAIADSIVEGMRKEGFKAWHVEGHTAGNWILIDYVDVVVHVFNRDTREFYSLETLWGDAPAAEIDAPPCEEGRE